jgi:replicative DNA helicase
MDYPPTDPKKDPFLYQVPPQSVEAEAALISAILLDSSSLLDIVDILTSEDFYKTAHQLIFEAVLDLFNANEPVDLISLSNRIKERGDIEKIGGAAY